MGSFSTFLRFLLISVALLAPVEIEAQQTPAPASSPGADAEQRNGLEQETFYLINQYRKANKLALLQWDNSIAKVARLHSHDMATGVVDFGHDGFGDRVTQLKAVMTGLNHAGENVLKTDDPNQVAQSAVTLWLGSPHHLENIRGDYNFSGLGVWVDKEGTIYFTQIFVKIKPQAQPTQTASAPQVVSPLGLLAAPQTRTQP